MSSDFDIAVSRLPTGALTKDLNIDQTTELTISAFVKLPYSLIKAAPRFTLFAPRFVASVSHDKQSTTSVISFGCDAMKLHVVTTTKTDKSLRQNRYVKSI